MGNRSALIISLIFIGVLSLQEADAGIIGDAANSVWSGIEYFLTSVESIITDIVNPPRNSNSSIQYELYTASSPQDACYLEQNKEALERCPFNSTYPLKILIHGFLTNNPQLFREMKTRMLQLYEYNVIVMDWTKYNNPPYTVAAVNTQFVGHRLANFIQFLENSKGVDPKNVHLIGHSLGAQVAGAAGKKTPNLGQITGLDPAIPLFSERSILHRLTYKDAAFVDIIHTGTDTFGLGVPEPIGHQDFYPNGGYDQPQCVANQDSETPELDETMDEETISKDTFRIDRNLCDHLAPTLYYIESINPAECLFLGVLCDSYEDFQEGACSNGSKPITKMGLPARPIPGLSPQSEFYLRTGANPPYCLEDGYEPA